MASGLIVVFLGITGCMLAFEQEIRTFTNREQFTAKQEGAPLPPERLRTIAEKALGGKKINVIEYPGANKSALASWYDAENYQIVYLDPYTGKVLAVKNMNRDFFRVVLMGHYYLWLPPNVGQPIVASATLIFLVMIITGLVLWWPKNRAARKQRFSVKLNARWRRVNYDLHNVLGFYMTWVVIFIVITGLVWGFDWFARSFYTMTSLGKAMPGYSQAVSDTTHARPTMLNATDSLWNSHLPSVSADKSISVYFPQSKSDPIQVIVNHRPGTYYDTENFFYDQYTGRPLPADGVDARSFASATVANKIKRLNYDVHVGAALGIAGKIMAFFASLIAASLPITGFYIWWGKKKKKIPLAKTKKSSVMKPVASILSFVALWMMSACGNGTNNASVNTDSTATDSASVAKDSSAGSAGLKEENVTISADTTNMQCFAAYDDSKKEKRPIVLVLPEWWGLNEYPKMRARELARLGYFALAVDIYGNAPLVEIPTKPNPSPENFIPIPCSVQAGSRRRSPKQRPSRRQTALKPQRSVTASVEQWC